jgi:hypothetical protein
MATEQIPTGLIADDAVTGAKIENNPTVAGNLAVAGTSTLTGNSTVGGTLATTGALTASGGIANAGTITAGTLGSSVVFPAGHIVKTSKTANMRNSGHVSTTATSLEASGLIVSSPATTGSNYNLITLSTATYMDSSSEMAVRLYVSYNGGSYAVLGNSNYGPKHGGHNVAGHRAFSFTWIDNSGSTSAGTNLYQIYFMEVNSDSAAYLIHNLDPYLFMVQEVQA